MHPHVSLGSIRTDQLSGPRSAGEGKINLKAIINSYTLLDFLSDGDMLASFTFVEEHMVWHAANLRAHGVQMFYVSRLFNKGDKCDIGNWLEYEDKEVFAACYKIWQQFLTDTSDKFNLVSETVFHFSIFQYVLASCFISFFGEIAGRFCGRMTAQSSDKEGEQKASTCNLKTKRRL